MGVASHSVNVQTDMREIAAVIPDRTAHGLRLSYDRVTSLVERFSKEDVSLVRVSS